MRAILILVGIAALAVIVLSSLGMLSIEQQQGMSLPRVSLNAEGGQLPKFKAETGSIDIGTTNTSVEVPTMEMKNKSVSVPTIQVKPAPGASPAAQ